MAVALGPRGGCPLPVHGLTYTVCSHRSQLGHRHDPPWISSGPVGPTLPSSTSRLCGHSSQPRLNDCISDKKHEQGAQPLKVSSRSPPLACAFRSIPCRFPSSRAVHARRSGYARRRIFQVRAINRPPRAASSVATPVRNPPRSNTLTTVACVAAGGLRGGSDLPSAGEGGANAAAAARDVPGERW